HYLDGQLIPEGTCYAYSPHRRDGSSGLEYAGSRYLPTGSVRAIVPWYRRDRSDLLPLHPRDHPIRAIHRAGRRHCGHLLHARHRTYACHWHSERARSPLIPNQEKERATSGSPHLYEYLANRKEALQALRLSVASTLADHLDRSFRRDHGPLRDLPHCCRLAVQPQLGLALHTSSRSPHLADDQTGHRKQAAARAGEFATAVRRRAADLVPDGAVRGEGRAPGDGASVAQPSAQGPDEEGEEGPGQGPFGHPRAPARRGGGGGTGASRGASGL